MKPGRNIHMLNIQFAVGRHYLDLIKMKSIYPLILVAVIFIVGCNKYAQIKNQNIQIIELYVNEIWNKWNLSLIDSIIGEDFVDPASTTGEKGPDAFKEVVAGYRTTFPDLKITIDEMIADENKVAWKWTASGTNDSTGERETFSGIIIDRIEEGKIVQRIGKY